jgi:hypothetical protein
MEYKTTPAAWNAFSDAMKRAHGLFAESSLLLVRDEAADTPSEPGCLGNHCSCCGNPI